MAFIEFLERRCAMGSKVSGACACVPAGRACVPVIDRTGFRSSTLPVLDDEV